MNVDAFITEENLPYKFVVCDRCDGHGTHGNPAFDGAPAEFWDDDPEFVDDYIDGRYDVVCEECNGLRVVREINYALLDADMEMAVREAIDELRDSYETSRQERMMEMGAAYFYG